MKIFFEVISFDAMEENRRSPLIFLHGIVISKKSWKHVAPVIARKTGRKAYLLDARNHGQSPWSDEMNYDVLTADVVEFMDTHDIEKGMIVGHSMGGRTAINLALRYPNRVEGLIVEEMTPRNVQSGSNSVVQILYDLGMEYLRTMPTDLELDEAKRIMKEDAIIIIHPIRGDKEKWSKNFDWNLIPVVKEGNNFRPEFNEKAVITMMRSNSLVQNLPQTNLVFDGDALFIYGTKGFFNLDKDKTVKQLFPRAVVRRVEKASHLVHMDSPTEYIEIVSEFILHRNGQPSKY